MKKFLLLAICALSVCLTGCSDNDTPEQLPDPELTLAPDAPIVFPAEGGSVEITVTTNKLERRFRPEVVQSRGLRR